MKVLSGAYAILEQNLRTRFSEKAIYSGAIPGMLRTLDPHSNFLIRRSTRTCSASSARNIPALA